MLDDFTRAFQIDPLHSDAICNRGILYATIFDYQNAVPDLVRALEINPYDQFAPKWLARIQEKTMVSFEEMLQRTFTAGPMPAGKKKGRS
ncbi:tetratricopeptide repeat protein [Paraflavitalea speifideaquila]|uniref:tetratricopeptide repeat protein n=1 Tax=Paraflavitalea speifideaquila TaxID=3076558 RepID=UPI0028E4609A|nr:tetratricopeptide repeat protein [Paraflavitalea speifideiaquila]